MINSFDRAPMRSSAFVICGDERLFVGEATESPRPIPAVPANHAGIYTRQLANAGCAGCVGLLE
jgi:hypothetical protein